MLNNILCIVGIIGFSVVIVDAAIEWVNKYKKRNSDLQPWERRINNLYDSLDRLERRIMGKIEIIDHSITNLSTRDKELEEMIRWYAGELKKEELQDWTYIQPDGSIETHSLRDEVEEDPPVLEEKEDQMSFFDILCEAFQQRQMMSEEEEDEDNEESQSE